MKKLLLSLGSIAIFGIGVTINSLNLFEAPKTTENNISKLNYKKLSNSKKENIFQESTFESSCCPEILNN